MRLFLVHGLGGILRRPRQQPGSTINRLSTQPMRMAVSQAATGLKFASFDVTNQVFYSNHSSFAIVNLKPIAPGHVLVIPKRTDAKRLRDLRPDEVAELFKSVQEISSVIEAIHKATSLTIAIQDGPDAGQSVPHLHVHVIPRRPNDFVPNDKIYDHLNSFDASEASDTIQPTTDKMKVDNDARQARTADDMQQEATLLAEHFQK